MPWDVLEQKRGDHTYTPEVRSSSEPASLHPGQSIKKRENISTKYYIRHSPESVIGDVPNAQSPTFPCYTHNININKLQKIYITSGEVEKKAPIFFFAYGEKYCAPKIACCAARRLLHKTAILTQMLRPRNSATAINALVATGPKRLSPRKIPHIIRLRHGSSARSIGRQAFFSSIGTTLSGQKANKVLPKFPARYIIPNTTRLGKLN